MINREKAAIRNFRCIHGLKAGHCSYCSPSRPLGKRTIILENGNQVRCRKGMYRHRHADRIEFVAGRFITTKQYTEDAVDLDKELMVGTYHKRLAKLRTARGENQEYYKKLAGMTETIREVIEYHPK